MLEKILQILEAMLFTAGEPLSILRIQNTLLATENLTSENSVSENSVSENSVSENLVTEKSEENSFQTQSQNISDFKQTDFKTANYPSHQQIREWLNILKESYQDRGIELVEVASGFRFQAKKEHAVWIQRMFEKKPSRYSRAFLETLALIVYRQPITRGEIEEIRGVSVSSQIIKTLTERNWIKVVGARDLPGKPALLGTTKQFLDDFNLKNLADLPPLQQITDLEAVADQLEMEFEVLS